MDTKKILSADLLDLIFDNRNKDYGAYELRKTYHTRITQSLIFTGVFVTLIFTGVVLANKLTPNEKSRPIVHGEIILANLKEEKPPEALPEPIKKREPVQIKKEKLTNIKVVDDKEVVEPPPTQLDLATAIIDVFKQAGDPDAGVKIPQNIDGRKDIIETHVTKDEPISGRVDIDAKFDGNWQKFLLRNLNAQTPVENSAPAGNYKVLIQFVVDIDGTVSDIKPLTTLGYGLEEEAIRVLKKAKNWEPAIQNGRQVKAYRIQAITFQVTGEE